ncbi:MAG: SpoIIE family protein phosphatase, partial [Lachnospiraceae bacterium]|nr:SpoIIE family protein phosphatase [Lachnospiraceae bacterium]
FVPESELERPSDILLEEMDAVTMDTLSSFSGKYKNFLVITVIALMLLVANAAFMALVFSKKLVTPIQIMTKGVKDIDGENMSFEMQSEYETGDEIETLANAFHKLTGKINDYIVEITRISAEKERIDTEMATAKQIQDSMLPKIFPAFPEREEFELYADMKPAKEVGGDLYDYYFIDDDRLTIVIGDVSGKGISAALFMVMTKHIIQSQVMLHNGDVVKALEGVNTVLMEENAAGMFVTVWLGVLEVSSGRINYINAGHEYPIIYRNGDEFRLYKDNHGAPVACSKNIRLKPNEIVMKPGDVLYLYTDGITEASDKDLNMFGQDRIIDVLNSGENRTVDEMDKAVRDAISDFAGDAEQFDDMTSLIIRYHGPKR